MGSPPHLAMMWAPFFGFMGQYEGIAGQCTISPFFPPLGFPGKHEFALSFLGSCGLDATYWYS